MRVGGRRVLVDWDTVAGRDLWWLPDPPRTAAGGFCRLGWALGDITEFGSGFRVAGTGAAFVGLWG